MNVVDFFCGAGGFSKGLENAGLRILAGIDYNPDAIATFNKNHSGKGYVRDITQLSTQELRELIKNEPVDVIVGGFPCQGFSLLGRRKKNDPRNILYKELLRFIGELRPQYFVLENVKGLLSMKHPNGEKVLPIILKDLMALGYSVSYKLLLASDYGVPQNRERVLIFGQRCSFFELQKVVVKKTVFDAINDLPSAEEGINAHVFTEHSPEYEQKLGSLKPESNDPSAFKITNPAASTARRIRIPPPANTSMFVFFRGRTSVSPNGATSCTVGFAP